MPTHRRLAHQEGGRSARPRGLRLRAQAAFALLVLLGALDLPLLSLALAGEPASFCGTGRCCCGGKEAGREDRPACLRRSCGCGHPDAVPAVEPLRDEAVLPRGSVPALPMPWLLHRTGTRGGTLTRPHAPPVPPPKRPLPA
jgi:hypothetical protein